MKFLDETQYPLIPLVVFNATSGTSKLTSLQQILRTFKETSFKVPIVLTNIMNFANNIRQEMEKIKDENEDFFT